MSNSDEGYVEGKKDFFHAFIKGTFYSIIGTAVTLAILALIFV